MKTPIMKVAFFIGIIVGLALVSILYDITASLTHTNSPHFYAAPRVICDRHWIVGVTLPPFGIWLCPAEFSDSGLRKHELVHWNQYKRYGTLGFYAEYIYGWAAGGFSYANNPMEKEAVEKSGC